MNRATQKKRLGTSAFRQWRFADRSERRMRRHHRLIFHNDIRFYIQVAKNYYQS